MTATSTYEYRYDKNWQLTKCTETLQNGIITEYDYQYDKDGNRSKYVKTVNGEWTECYTYEYNSANQLVKRTNERLWTDNVTYYTYDATRENEEVLAELSPRGKVTTAYTYGYTRESADVYGDIQYYLYDGQGNVSRISSEWGRVKETYSYDPYGNLTYGIPDTVNYYGYNGESSNLATGLQYLRARYYNPQNGNFITEDTYAGQVSNPLTLNRYDYVSNNPLNYIDPSGHYSLEQFGKDVGNFFGGIYDAFQRGYDIQQQNQQYEQQIMSDFYNKIIKDGKQAATDLYDKIVDCNQKAKEAEDEVNSVYEDWIDDIVDDGVEAFNSWVNQQEAVRQQQQQAEEEVRQAFCEMLEEHETELKVAAGTAVIVGTGAVTVLTGGTTSQQLLGSIIGGVAGSIIHYLFAEGDKADAAADGYMWGAITGALSPTIGHLVGQLGKTFTTLSNPVVASAIEGFLETVMEEFAILMQGGEVNFGMFITDWAFNSVTSGSNPQMQKLQEWFDGVLDKGKNLIKNLFGAGDDAISNSTGKEVVEEIVEGGLDASIKNIDEFIGGNKSFDDVLDDYAKVYADKINSNQAWSWDDTIPGGENLTKKQRSIIKQQAIDAGLIPDIKVTKVEGMRYGFADFESAGVVKETQYLPENMWKMSDAEQFKWLDEQIGGTVDGYTWHHTEIPGKMQLVPTGIHNITTHNGGRTAGMWADAPR